ncbi:MAG TPA: FAD-dependent thymidylate synthase [Verrucomicrobiae bacterium]|nr:FAD-dependent thymidylate synthase [Verrucomicrobiae bacterium]
MKVTQVAICPSDASKRAGRPALTPELLAASGARYSRNNEGLESILAKIDPANLEKSVESIFRMVDYGHQSIADMVPVAMFMDGISIWLAYYIWTLCPTAGGQESSTRYLKLSEEGLVSPEVLGIPSEHIQPWRELMRNCFEAYQSAVACWEKLARENPALLGIPRSLLNDSSEAAQKKVARMRRNYAFDRARYLLPVSAATNVMMIMSARGWVNLCQYLLSQRLPEPRQLGELIRAELEIAAPRMLKYARATEPNQQVLADEFASLVQRASLRPSEPENPFGQGAVSAKPFLAVMPPEGCSHAEISNGLGHHSNRYAPFGSWLQRTAVRFGWSSIGFAEIRDLNRHRTGTKHCPQVPSGFYCALDQLTGEATSYQAPLLKLTESGSLASSQALEILKKSEPTYIYWSVLGTEYPFEHTTTADKFIYEAELRTGLGAHFRYARHLRDVLELWYAEFPTTKGLILEGSAEPE